MPKHLVYDIRGREVGWWDNEEVPRIYHTQRNYNQNQIFKSSGYHNDVGIDVRIVEKVLMPNNINYVDYLITGVEKISFHAYMSLKRFLELGREVDFEGRQIIVPIGYFDRHHPKESLEAFKVN